MKSFRIEHGLMGDREVPAEACFGAHALRAVGNFPASGTPIANMSQSTNDVYPTTLKLAGHVGIKGLMGATQECGAFVQASELLKRVAVNVSKVCNDLRFLSSGPRAGLGELRLAPVQAGSSIMPGKVKPAIPEVVNLRAGPLALAERRVRDITANEGALRESVQNSIGPVTALNPYIGHAYATDAAQEALLTGASAYSLARTKNLLTKEQRDEIPRPEVLTQPRANGPIQ